jgi:hypothetical protein
MFDAAPILPPVDPPRRNRRLVAAALLSVVLHGLVLAWLLLPPAAPSEPADPSAINVDLVPPSEASSAEPSSSAPPPSSAEASSSTEPPSSDEPSSEEAQSSMAPAPSGEPSSSVEPASSQAAASSAEVSSSAALAPSAASSGSASSEEQASSGQQAASASSAEASSTSAASEPAASSASAEQAAKPLIVPLGPSEASQPASADDASISASEAPSDEAVASSAEAPSAAADEESSVLTTGADDASDSVDTNSSASASSAEAAPDTPPPVKAGLLRSAKRFYSAAMLDAPAMEKVRKALKTLPPEKRLAQTCNIEAAAQIGSAGRGFTPNALVANAFADPVIAGTSYSVSNGAFRSGQKWYGVGYSCKLSKDYSAVTSFAFHIGSDVTAPMQARFGH